MFAMGGMHVSNEILLAFAGLFLAPLAGGLISGIDRKLTARAQGRVGRTITQPSMTRPSCGPRTPPLPTLADFCSWVYLGGRGHLGGAVLPGL
jgi:ech hydrogenase subunit B